MTLVIGMFNLKGGAQKTTSTGYLCAAFHEAGLRPVGVDADGENESLAEWQAVADLPWPVIGMAKHNIHTQLPGVIGDRFDVAVIDTPPMRAQKGTVASAMRAADIAVITLAPTPIDYARVAAVRELVDEVTPLRPDGRPLLVTVLLTKCPGYPANSPKVFRQQLMADGLHVLTAQIGRSEKFAQAWASPIDRALGGPYGDVANELLDLANQQDGDA